MNEEIISADSENECEPEKNECGTNIVETFPTLNKIGLCPALDEKIIAILGDIAQARESLSINLQRLRTYVLELIVSCLVMVLVIGLRTNEKSVFF